MDALMDNREIWIRQTKLIGLDGEPLELYHATRAKTPFTEFEPSVSGAQGPGIYMADAAGDYSGRVMRLNVRMLNPFYFYPSDESIESEINGELIEQVLPADVALMVMERIDREGYDSYGTEVQQALKAQGHDGIVMIYPFGEPKLQDQPGAAVVIAFDSKQVLILPEVLHTPARALRDDSPSL
jgi:uncharacterized protein (DUF1330 family)